MYDYQIQKIWKQKQKILNEEKNAKQSDEYETGNECYQFIIKPKIYYSFFNEMYFLVLKIYFESYF